MTTQAPPHNGALRRLGNDLAVVLPAAVVARALVALGWVAAGVLRGGSEPTDRLRAEGLMAWDGTWYRDIAEFGYAGLPTEALRFFPGYPLLARALAEPFAAGGTAVTVALVAIANVAAVVAAVALRRLVIAERNDVALANRAAVALTLFPTAFVAVWAYSEALFLVGAIGVLWGVRTRRWWWAALAGFVAGATRPLGLFLAGAAVIEAVRNWRGAAATERVAMAGAVAGPVVGTGVWLLWVGNRFGSALEPLTGQGEFRGEAVNPVVRIFQGFGDLLGDELLGDGLHLPFALAFVVLTVVVARTWPASYTVFTVAVLLVALAAENLNSLERYALNAFPIVLAVAVVCSKPWRSWLALGVGGAGVVALSALSWMGIYVP